MQAIQIIQDEHRKLWRVASTIIGVTSMAQLDEDIDAFGTTLSPELLTAIDALRWETGDPAI